MEKFIMETPSDFIPSYARGLNILLADDDEKSLMYITAMLQQYTFKVTATKLASVALSKIEEEKDKFKIVMINVNIPDMDIFQFLGHLLEKDIPVILIAPERDVSAATQAIDEGACFYLDKPIALDDLKYVWQHAFRRRARREPNRIQIANPEENVTVPRKKSRTALTINDTVSTSSKLIPTTNGRQRHGSIHRTSGSTTGNKLCGISGRIAGSTSSVLFGNDLQYTAVSSHGTNNGANSNIFKEVAILNDAFHQNLIIDDTKCKSTDKGKGKIFEMEGPNHHNMISSDNKDGGKSKVFDDMDQFVYDFYDQDVMICTRGHKGKQVAEVEVMPDTIYNQHSMRSTADLISPGKPIEMGFTLTGETCTKEPENAGIEQLVVTEGSQKEGGSLMSLKTNRSAVEHRRAESNPEQSATKDKEIWHEVQVKEWRCNEKVSNENEAEEEKEKSGTDSYSINSSTEKRNSFIWTPDLHIKFTAAVSKLGEASPKQILDMMNVPNLSECQVANHLKSHKAQVKKTCENTTTNAPALSEPSNFCSRTEASQILGNTSTVRSQLGSQRLNFGIGGDVSLFLKEPTDVLTQDIHAPRPSEEKNNGLVTTPGTTKGQDSVAEHFTSGTVPNAIKLPANSADENKKMDATKVPNSVSDNVATAEKFLTDFSDVNQELDAIATSDPSAHLLNQSETKPDYGDVLNMRYEEPTESTGLAGIPSSEKLDNYCMLLKNILIETEEQP